MCATNEFQGRSTVLVPLRLSGRLPDSADAARLHSHPSDRLVRLATLREEISSGRWTSDTITFEAAGVHATLIAGGSYQ